MHGHVVNRAKSIAGKNNAWIHSLRWARQELGTQGFCPLRKNTKQYQYAKYLHAKLLQGRKFG